LHCTPRHQQIVRRNDPSEGFPCNLRPDRRRTDLRQVLIRHLLDPVYRYLSNLGRKAVDLRLGLIEWGK
jgi:hypothetical protein